MIAPAPPANHEPDPRRRDARVHRAILEATVELLESGGYKRLTIEAIAARAGVGKQTIYRWWPSKAAVVMEAYIAAGLERVPEPDTGILSEDLRAILVPVFRWNAAYHRGTALANKSMMAEAQINPVFHETYVQLHRSWWGPLHHVLERAKERGELRPDADSGALIDLMLGASWYRLLLEHAPLDERFAEVVIATVVNGNRPR
ncbi:MAG: TetR/AcrR family transcriptional regulator [Chloroflexota bacterium]|nr:TetR/AcrR family transcriptional regulator [Chloroflexota bacterium]